MGAGAIERFLEAERDQLPLWLPVALGSGIAAWFVLPGGTAWQAWLLIMAAIAAAALLAWHGGRLRRVMLVGAVAGAAGMALIWWRADSVAAPVLSRPVVMDLIGRVERVEVQPARERVRVTLAVDNPGGPARVRVNADTVPEGLAAGERVKVRARLLGPQAAPVPGGFDFARVAWFQRLGATGRAIGPVERVGPRSRDGPALRERLSAHIRSRLEGSAGGIAAAFATGDRGGIALEDEEAMRASGLTHLLSVSGLHVTAVVGAALFLSLRLLALSSWAALRLPLLVISACVGAAAGIGYTLLTGAEVPTVRSCVAAVLVLIGIAIGREAFTLRLVAAGAVVVLLLWPESVIGPSFQLSFAAITAIVALHELPAMRRLSGASESHLIVRFARFVLLLLITGIVVEIALAPIALFHFHKQGLYGAFANIVAIPLTTFVIMPLEAAALLLDAIGLGAPLWWLTGLALELLLGLARAVAAVPGAQAALATVPLAAFALMIAGGLWLLLWRGRVRACGLVPITAGAIWSFASPAPDLLVTGDGMHLAVRGPDGRLATLRPRAGEYVRSVLAERSGTIEPLVDLDTQSGARCTRDVCRIDLERGGRTWRVVATRSRYLLPPAELRTECAGADIVVSDRRLPDWCRPRWFKADWGLLAKTGGIAVTFGLQKVETVADGEGAHPWVLARAAAAQ